MSGCPGRSPAKARYLASAPRVFFQGSHLNVQAGGGSLEGAGNLPGRARSGVVALAAAASDAARLPTVTLDAPPPPLVRCSWPDPQHMSVTTHTSWTLSNRCQRTFQEANAQ
jgi:hypothetical protein